jgi:hypothetical protein
MTHTELNHPTDISNTSCGTVVGFIPVPRSRRLLVCQQIALRFATALKREAFSSILRNPRGTRLDFLRVLQRHLVPKNQALPSNLLHELRETTMLFTSLLYFIGIDTELIEHFLLRLPIID